MRKRRALAYEEVTQAENALAKCDAKENERRGRRGVNIQLERASDPATRKQREAGRHSGSVLDETWSHCIPCLI